MTSGNRSDEPIAFDDDDARERLRRSRTPSSPTTARSTAAARTRSFGPVSRSAAHAASPRTPFRSRAASGAVVAAGAELKNTFCVARGAEAFLSPHLGTSTPRRPTARSGATSRSTSRCSASAPESDRPRPPSRLPLDPLGDRAGGASWSGSSTTMPTPRPASRSTAKRARPWPWSSTGPATAPTGRSGAASCCAATSRGSSGSPIWSRSRFPAARPRSVSRGAPPPHTSSGRTARCRFDALAEVRREPEGERSALAPEWVASSTQSPHCSGSASESATRDRPRSSWSISLATRRRTPTSAGSARD